MEPRTKSEDSGAATAFEAHRQKHNSTEAKGSLSAGHTAAKGNRSQAVPVVPLPSA